MAGDTTRFSLFHGVYHIGKCFWVGRCQSRGAQRDTLRAGVDKPRRVFFKPVDLGVIFYVAVFRLFTVVRRFALGMRHSTFSDFLLYK